MEKVLKKEATLTAETKERRKLFLTGVAITTLSIIIAMLPPFGSLERPAMIYLGAFIWMILMMTIPVIPQFIVPMITLLVLIIFGITDFNVAFAPFGSSTIWLIIGVLGLSVAIGESGVLNRLVLYLLKPFPETYNFQILAVYVTNLILAPAIPSNFGKLAILSPLAVNMGERYGYEKSSKGAIGLFDALYMSAGIFGHAFLTGSAAAAIMIGFMNPDTQNFNFLSWLSGTWVWLLVVFIGSYFFIITYYHPKGEQKIKTGIIDAEIKKLEPISRNEIITLLIMVTAVGFWITESFHGVNATLVVLCALSLFIATGVLTPSSFNKSIDWRTIIFVGCIFGVANFIGPLGITEWIAGNLRVFAGPLGHNPYIFVFMLCLLTFVARFFIISPLVLIAIFVAVFGSLAESIGVSSFIVVYIVYLVSQDWNTPFNNFAMITTLSTTENKLAEYKDTYPMNLAFFVLNVIGFLVSIPFWQIAGFIR